MSVAEYGRSSGQGKKPSDRSDRASVAYAVSQPDGIGVQATIMLGFGAVLTVLWTASLVWAAGRLVGFW
jgi:hypothetical protein